MQIGMALAFCNNGGKNDSKVVKGRQTRRRDKLDRQCAYNVTYRPVHATTVAVEKQKVLHIL
jgi:hypothetical protein